MGFEIIEDIDKFIENGFNQRHNLNHDELFIFSSIVHDIKTMREGNLTPKLYINYANGTYYITSEEKLEGKYH